MWLFFFSLSVQNMSSTLVIAACETRPKPVFSKLQFFNAKGANVALVDVFCCVWPSGCSYSQQPSASCLPVTNHHHHHRRIYHRCNLVSSCRRFTRLSRSNVGISWGMSDLPLRRRCSCLCAVRWSMGQRWVTFSWGNLIKTQKSRLQTTPMCDNLETKKK